MAIESQNIYKNARKSAGFTQEKASQLLNVSVDSLRDYEQSQRPVPSDVASAMCDVYQAPYLAVQHLRLTSDLGKRVVPEIQLKDLPEAVLGVLAAVQRFCAKREAMVEIAADGQIAESEQAEWDEIMCLANDLNVAIRAYGKHYAYATDINGNRQYLEFTRVNDVYLLLSITVTSSGGLDDDYAARIKSLLMEENLSAGTTIRLQKFIRPIMENVSGVDYIEIRGLLSEKPEIETVVDSSMLTGIVPVQINQQPIISMSGIRVVKA